MLLSIYIIDCTFCYVRVRVVTRTSTTFRTMQRDMTPYPTAAAQSRFCIDTYSIVARHSTSAHASLLICQLYTTQQYQCDRRWKWTSDPHRVLLWRHDQNLSSWLVRWLAVASIGTIIQILDTSMNRWLQSEECMTGSAPRADLQTSSAMVTSRLLVLRSSLRASL